METFATQNQNHMGATVGQNFSALGGKFWDVSQLILLAGQMCKGMSHPLCFQPSSLWYLNCRGMTFQMEPLTISITNISSIVFIQVSQNTYHVLFHLQFFPHIVPSDLRESFLISWLTATYPLSQFRYYFFSKVDEVRCSCYMVSQL